jgi:hypothetical protein
MRSVCFKEHDSVKMMKSQPVSRAQSPVTSDEDDGEVAVQAVRCQSVRCCAAADSRSSQPTPTVMASMRVSGTTFSARVTPDSGTTRTVVARDVLDGVGVGYSPTTAKLFVADDRRMDCSGRVTLRILQFDGHTYKKAVTIRAVVCADLHDEILLSWHDLVQLSVLPEDFPAVQKSQASQKLAAAAPVEVKKVDVGESRRVTAVAEDSSEALFRDFPDVLSDELTHGHMLGKEPMKIQVRTDVHVRPVRRLTARPIPVHFRKEADRMVEELIAEGILARVEHPTDWISAGHFVPKPDGKRVRLVTDFTDLNLTVKRPVHPFPSTGDILQGISAGSTWFAKLDAVHGYFQVPLDDESSYLTTFLLPSGRYRYLRAPMGLCSSGDEFCRRSDEVLHGLTYCQKIVDDILVQATSQAELFTRIREVLRRCREHGLTISRRKLEIGQKVQFAGHVVSAEGVQPDPELLRAVAGFPTPTDVTSLRSFLGMANQLSWFLPDSAHSMVKMRQLLKKNASFTWLPDHDIEFAAAKKLLVSDQIVRFFDPSLPTVLLADASRLYGIGFALVQTNGDGSARLIRCGSSSLTPTQGRYATIELEMLAIAYAVRKCAFYLRGMDTFKIVTDHRPLLGVFRKPLHEVDNPRLQRMRGQLDGSGYVFSVEWNAGKDHLIADALSRAPVFLPDEDSDVDYRVCRIVDDDAWSIFRDAASDVSYTQCVEALRGGVLCSDLPPGHPACELKSIYDLLSVSVEGGVALVIYDGNRVVVPHRARADVLRRLHLSHSGVTKTRELARQLYFWHGMSTDIKQMIEACAVCVRALPSQVSEPFVSADFPTAAMLAVGVDLCEYAGNTWLVMVDRFSGFPFAVKLRRTCTSHVTAKMLAWFRDWGFPQRVRSDGGPQFRAEFKEFCAQWGIVHEVSSPYNPASNGLAEAAVKNVKRLVAKCGATGQNFDEALFAFRNTPRADGVSPAQMMFGRRQRGLLPVTETSLREHVKLEEAAAIRESGISGAAVRHDVRARELSKLKCGQRVVVQDPKTGKWDAFAVILGPHVSGHSYDIEFYDGRVSSRNRRLLRPRNSAELACVLSKSGKSGESGDVSAPAPVSALRRSARLADAVSMRLRRRRVSFSD